MHLLRNPHWINQHEYMYAQLEDVPASVFEMINTRLDARQTSNPVVSIVVAAYNEEVNLIRSVSTLSNLSTTVPYEIILVNNNSTDRTQETIDRLHVRSVFQPIQGCGPARQLGQEAARGEFILQADSDCLYPPNWLNEMLNALKKPNVACVYGRYSFIATDGFPRWQLAIHEMLRGLMAEIRHLKRPYLNAGGASMGYRTQAGLAVGFVMRNIRGEDGRMCFDLMQHGEVVAVKTQTACVWTGPRSLARDGTFAQAMRSRVVNQLQQIPSYFTKHPPHDTKTSEN